jgi:hypothetical protein
MRNILPRALCAFFRAGVKPARTDDLPAAGARLDPGWLSLPILLAFVSPSPAADDPLTRIVPPKDGTSVCFERRFDKAHLKRHRRQQTTHILLSFLYQGNDGVHIERIAVTRRGKAPLLYFAGGCDFSEQANRSSSGERLMHNYPKDAGYACIALTAPNSAREGGYFLIDLAEGGSTATLYLASPIESMQGKDGRGSPGEVHLGRSDRVFRLQRTDPSACRALEEALPDLP